MLPLQPVSPSMLSMDNFIRAVDLTHTYQPGATQQQRQEAEQYLMELRATSDGLGLAFDIISSEPVQVACFFWAFNTIMHHMPIMARSVNDEKAEELYVTLFSFIYRYFFLSGGSATPSSTSGASSAHLTTASLNAIDCDGINSARSQGPQRQSIDYLANKHAQLMVAGLQEFFPTRWRTFFDNAFELIERSVTLPPNVRDSVTLYVLRLFEYIDERVVSVRERNDRDREQRARDMEVKDAMREHVIPRATAFWYATLCECQQRAPELANLCVNIVQTYIEWVDISLFFTPNWINLLYFTLTTDNIRGAACDCLCGLVEKKQVPSAKLDSLRTLNVVEMVTRVVSLAPAAPETDEDVNFTESVAKFVREVAEQFLSLYEHISNNHNNLRGGVDRETHANVGFDSGSAETNTSPHSLEWVKSTESTEVECGMEYSHLAGVKEKNLQECPRQKQLSHRFPDGQLSVEYLGEVQAGLDAVLPEVLRLLAIRHDVVVDVLLPFIQTYVKSPALREDHVAQLLLILYDHTIIRGMAECEDAFWMDDVIDRRKQMHNIIRLLFRGHPLVVMPHIQAVVARAAGAASAPTDACTRSCGQGNERGDEKCAKSPGPEEFSSGTGTNGEAASATFGGFGGTVVNPEEVEAALRYLYELGESFRMEQLRESSNEFAQLVFVVLTSEHIPRYPCSAVHVSYFEVLDRYCAFFTYHKSYMPLLLQRLVLMPNGIMNPNPGVRARICCLFGHLMQVLKTPLVPHVQEIITALQHILRTVKYLLPCNRRDLYEAMGTLLSAIPQSAPTSVVDGTAITLQVLQVVAETLRDASASDNIICAEVVADEISFLTALVKGLRGSNGGSGTTANGSVLSPSDKFNGGCSCSAPGGDAKNNSGVSGALNLEHSGEAAVGEIFHRLTSDVTEVFSKWHTSASVRDRVGQYFTQAVHVLSLDSMKLCIPMYISNWLVWMEAVPELVKLLRFLLQFIHRGGSGVRAILSCLMPQVLEKVGAVGGLSTEDDKLDIVPESAREQRDVYRQLFTVVHSAAQAGCVDAILSLPASNLNVLLTQLLIAVQLPGETELPKLALRIMTKITTCMEQDSSGESNGNGAGYQPLPNGGEGTVTGISSNWMNFMLNDALRVVLERLLSPTFDLKDAKNLLFIGEAGLLLKSLINKLGPEDPSLSMMLYETFSSLVGTDEATGFISALQQQPGRFSTEMKLRFCNMLKFAKQQYEARR